MHNTIFDKSPRGSELRGRWGYTVMATVLLSFGVGAATAAFTLMDGAAPHSAPNVGCETMFQISSDPSTYMSASIPSSVELQERLSDAYQMSYEATGEAVGAWSDVTDNFDARQLASLLAAGALAVLVACARAAGRLLVVPRAPAIAAASAIGALIVAATLLDVLGLPALGFRAIAFAMSVSLIATKFARAGRKKLVPAA